MSDRTAPSLARLDALLALIAQLPPTPESRQLQDEGQALRRAVASFHMEAIRFRMYAVDRALQAPGTSAELQATFEGLRHELETAGFHTRSHTAPTQRADPEAG